MSHLLLFFLVWTGLVYAIGFVWGYLARLTSDKRDKRLQKEAEDKWQQWQNNWNDETRLEK